jgi:hypothetical protein
LLVETLAVGLDTAEPDTEGDGDPEIEGDFDVGAPDEAVTPGEVWVAGGDVDA